MFIHTYTTNGYIDWLVFFLKTLKHNHGEEWKVIIDGRDLNEDNINLIKKTYNNIEIKNKKIDYNKLINVSGLTKEEILQEKERVEKDKSINKKKNIIWKQYISVEDRYRNSIIETINENKDEDYIFHFDADTYVRKPIWPLIDLVYKNDISTIFRDQYWKSKKKYWKSVQGCFMAFKICPEINYFFDTWINIIDSVPLKKKPANFGQISFYKAYLKTKDKYLWGRVPKPWFVNKGGKNYKDCMIWTGCKGKKKDSLNRSKADYDNIT